MTPVPSLACEWRQLRLLSRDSVRRMLNVAFHGRETDPIPFLIWAVALVAAPPWMHAFRRTFVYASADVASAEVVERFVLGDRLFFLIYGMVASALLAALVWDALLPDRHDQEILGVLPVRPRTVAAARVLAAVGVAAAFAAVINIPSGLLFAISSTTHPAVGPLPMVFVAHVLATLLGSLCVFLFLIGLRGLTAGVASPSAAHVLATLLQVVTIVGLLEVFLFLPSVLPATALRMVNGDSSTAFLPPVWFAALYSWLAGSETVALTAGALTAVLAFAVSVALVIAVYLVPAAAMGRRTLEALPRTRGSALMLIASATAPLVARSATVRGVALFTVASLARSRRHLLRVATYLAFAVAAAGVSLLAEAMRGTIALTGPQPYLLALPLVLIFFLVAGLRSAFAIPTDLDANWPFRLSEPRVTAAMHATGVVMVMCAVVPVVVAAWLVAMNLGWDAPTAAAVALFDVASGMFLVECALWRWRKVPFTCAHAPAADTFRSRWAFFLVALNLFAFRLADLQAAALESPRRTLAYLAGMCVAALAVGIVRTRAARDARVQFDVPSDGLQTLGLSAAAQ